MFLADLSVESTKSTALFRIRLGKMKFFGLVVLL